MNLIWMHMSDDAALQRKDNFCLLSVLQTQLCNRFGRKPLFTDGAQWYTMMLV